MGDAKWVKVEVNMFDDTKLKIIDKMPDRDSIQYMWTRFIVLGGKINYGGYFYLTDGIPYTIKTFAIEFNRSIEEVKNAIKVLKKLEMIEFTEDKVFKIKNWDKHQNVEGLERLRNENNRRVAKHRAKKKEDKFRNEEEANNNVIEIDDNNKTIENNIEEINYKGGNDKVNQVEKDKENTSIGNEEVLDAEENIVENINKNKEVKTKEKYNGANLGQASEKDNNSNDNSNVKSNDGSNVIDSKNNNVKSNDESNVIGSDNTNANCNVTGNADNSNCNITVMEQKKKEINNKKKIKRESNMNFKEENKAIADEPSNSYDGNKASGTQSVNSKALEILMHYEKLTGIPGVFNLGSIALAIDMHGEKFVKMAINKALELNKKDMPYINGILKNWRREGYPKDDVEVKKDGSRCIGKNNATDKNEFTGFKPKESRKLTEEQRKRAEENLI